MKNPHMVRAADLFAASRAGGEYNEADKGARGIMSSTHGRMCTYSGKVIEMADVVNTEISRMSRLLSWDAERPVKPRDDG